MALSPETASYWIWFAWYFSWGVAALTAAKVASRPKLGGTLWHRLFAFLGVMLLFWSPTTPTAWVTRLATAIGAATGLDQAQVLHWTLPLVAVPTDVGWGLCGAIVLSFAFCWWARLHLGALWSGLVTTKADHRIVDTGPYGIVRHPIYTGVITAALFTAAIKASLPAFAGFGLIWLGFWMTARVEEGFLRQQLGPESYDAYRRRVPMLFPFMG
jgi:protein-S-isoprenylcysteine O-methyltransferase Ste14